MNTGDTSHHMYHVQKWDADTQYLGRVKMALSSCINFAYPANIRKAHEELMTQVKTKAIHISNKYEIQIECIQFEWDKFLPTLEKDFLEILNEVLSYNNHQQQLSNSNKCASVPNENKGQYSWRTDNRTRMLTTPSLSTTHVNRTNRFQHISHRNPSQLPHREETVISQTVHAKEFRIEGTHITPHP